MKSLRALTNLIPGRCHDLPLEDIGSRALEKRRLTSKTGIAIGTCCCSAVLLWMSLRGIDYGALGRLMAGSSFRWIGIAVFSNLASLWFRALRWRLIMRSRRAVTVGEMFATTMIGFMANNLLPARAGELLKVHVLAQDQGLSRMTVLGTVVVERLFDILLLLVLAFLIVVTGDSWQALRMRGALVYGGIVCAGLLALLLLVRHQSASMIRAGARLQDTRSMSVKRLAGAVSSFAAGLDCLSREDIGAMVLSVATSAAVWMCTLINIASGAKALNLSLPLSLSLPIMLVQSAGMLVPSGPANIGVFQFSTVASLAPFDVTKTTALGLSLVLHATRFFPTTLIGLAYFVARLHRRARRPSLQLKEY